MNTGLFSGDGDRLACDEGLVIFLCLTPGTPAIAVLALSERGTWPGSGGGGNRSERESASD